MKTLFLALSILGFSGSVHAAELKVGDLAPLFQTKTNEGADFNLAQRKGKWTVLYFYPKADTPGCTKQACNFRDSIKSVKDLGAEVFGISADSVEDIAKFHAKYHLNFELLADPQAAVIESYGVKMPVMKMAKRWTFILDPELKIRHIDQNVDPVKDAANVTQLIKNLKASG